MGSEAGSPADLLAGAAWTCASTEPGSRRGPDDLDDLRRGWIDAVVPGTVAAALRGVGASEVSEERLDGQDWWYRCRFPRPVGAGDGDRWVLECEGLATLADVWLNGRQVLTSASMFATHAVPVTGLRADNELCIRFAALAPVLAERRPRPRWKSKGVISQNLRWLRTSMLGRLTGWAVVPPPVGPWRPIRLRPLRPVEIVRRRVVARCTDGPTEGTSGAVSVELEVTGPAPGAGVTAEVRVAGTIAPLVVATDGATVRLVGEVAVDGVERWWPHTHGAQPLYPVLAVVDGVELELGRVGFRTVEAVRDDDGFHLLVNGVAIFCRGSCWYPPDPVGYRPAAGQVEHLVELARRSGMNMLRVPGGTVYEDERFYGACDEAGVLVWQEAMLALVDPPIDEEFIATMVAEVTEVLDRAAGHPCLAVFCGGAEIEEQPAMFGLVRERWRTPLIHEVFPALVERVAPGLVYVTSSPSGGDLPFSTDAGICHYFGVGVYLFPLSDLRRADPRFVAEGLAFAVPPERATIDEAFGGGFTTEHESAWKRAVHRDAGSWFDLEDVRDHYAASMFGLDMAVLWRSDHEHALDLGRAAVFEIVQAAMSEWRRPSSPCGGFLAMALADLRPGPGWGLVDSFGRPKAPWYALARTATPVAVLATDEGVNGLALHLVNDTALDVEGTLVIGLHTGAHQVEHVSRDVVVPARGGVELYADSLFDGFRDLTYAYCFGPRSYELVTADLVDAEGRTVAGTGYLPGGPAREPDPDVGLQAEIGPADERAWQLRVTARRFAQYVQVDVPGYVPDDSWFHLPPGGSRTTVLRPTPGATTTAVEPRGWVRALNSAVLAAVNR